MARWNASKHPRDKYGRFAGGRRGGTVLKAVRGRRSKIINKGVETVRERSAGLRHGAFQNRMIAAGRGGSGYLTGKQVRGLRVASGTRKRGQTVRMVERVNKVVVIPTTKVRRSRAVRRRRG